jgi:hypothetical protein
VRVHARRAIKARPGGRAGADRLVILVGGVAEGEVVHRALGRRQRLGGAEHGVGDVLAGFHIAGHDGGRILRAQHGAFGDDEIDRLQATGIHRDRLFGQHAEHVKHRRAGHRFRRVEIVRAAAGMCR